MKRQKLLLALLEEWGGELSNTDMQKFLFLLSEHQDEGNRSYHFIPYKFGCFSLNSYSDKRKLIEKEILRESEDWALSKKQNGFYFLLSNEDRSLIKKIKKDFGHLSGKKLIRYIYLNYPSYAIKSEILNEVLNEPEITMVKACIPKNEIRALYTIGYEAKSIEEYINQLIKEDVKILLDVRKNPISRKYGYSKKTLQNVTEKVGIEYRHLPELGIPGEKRIDLTNIETYNRLFDEYEKEVLNNCRNLLQMIYRLVLENERICLTCFESHPAYCHRSRIAGAITRYFCPDLHIINL
ncbi:MAG: DUF488 domain-containing protein [Acidobacteria bacterium]|nr:DUF488 domain-containing protein [Acidobacteriota bacterium]